MTVVLDKNIVIKRKELEEFAISLLKTVGASDADSKIVASALVWADLRGRHPQGVNRLPIFIQRLQRGLIKSPALMQWKQIAPAAAMLDADNAFGHVAGTAAMKRAVELARVEGIGIVSVRRSNLYGAASYFSSIATEANCLGITCTNAVPKVAPYGGVRPVFGTNPIAFGCPTSSGVPILVDLSTSAIAGSSVRSMHETDRPLPEGVALKKNGTPTTSVKDIQEGTLLPAAGAKGFGLALMVEILCGVLAGAAMGKEVGSMYSTFDRPVNTGHVFLAIDIEKFQARDHFMTRIDLLLSWIKAAGTEEQAVRFPGEIRGELADRYEREGIPLPLEATVQPLSDLAKDLHLEAPW